MIVLNNVYKQTEYGSITGVSCEIPDSSVTEIIGDEESEREVLFDLISGMEIPDGGTVSYSKENVNFGVVKKSMKLYETMSAIDNILFFAKIESNGKESFMDRASYLMHKLEIWGIRDVPYYKLDTNSQRKLLFVRALVTTPDVLILFDGFSGLDKHSAKLCAELVSEENKNNGVTVMVFSDKPSSEISYDYYGILNEGSMIAFGDFDTVQRVSKLKNKALLLIKDHKYSTIDSSFHMNPDGYYEKDIEKDEDICDIIRNLVYMGNDILEARVLHQSIDSVYNSLTGIKEES